MNEKLKQKDSISSKKYQKMAKTIYLFMQNKPNLPIAKTNAKRAITRNYGKLKANGHRKTNPIQTQYYAKQTQNKPNFYNVQNWSRQEKSGYKGLWFFLCQSFAMIELTSLFNLPYKICKDKMM